MLNVRNITKSTSLLLTAVQEQLNNNKYELRITN